MTTMSFTDPEQPAVLIPISDNPYVSPSSCAPGWWDKTLLRRILKFIVWFCGFLMGLDALVAVWFFCWSPAVWVSGSSVLDQIRAFLTSWN